MKPLFNVEEDNTLVLVALARKCITAKPLLNPSTSREETKSAAVFMPIIDFIPWINGVLQKRCLCNINRYPIQQGIVEDNHIGSALGPQQI